MDVEELSSEFEQIIFLRHYFEHSHQPGQLYNFVDSSNFCNSDHTIEIVSILHEDCIEGKDGEDIEDKPSLTIVARNDTNIINNLKVLIIESAEERDDDIQSKNYIHENVNVLPGCQ